MASILSKLLGKPTKVKATGVSQASSPTYSSSSSSNVLSLPSYREHLTNLYDNRLTASSQDLIKDLATSDSDVSATINAYCTVANTKPLFTVKTPEGEHDLDGQQLLVQLWKMMTQQLDYTKGFQFRQAFYQMCADWRYMLLIRGGIASELVFGKGMLPQEVRTIDLKTIRWYEQKPGEYKPVQVASGSSQEISLDIPTFNCSFYRRNPLGIYTNSPFISAINTIAARQQVINDLYRIMQITGYPRIDVEVAEEVLMKNAPADVKTSPEKMRKYLDERLSDIASGISSIRADQAFIHYDAAKAKILNDKNPGAALDIQPIIKVLDAQNQAALKVVSPVIGRGEAGVNTASVEARIFSLNADEINFPLAEMLSNISTMMLNSQGRASIVDVTFKPSELRPADELEPMLAVKAARLRQDLSDGIITDAEYTLMMYHRHPNSAATPLSGTGFMTQTVNVATDQISPNSDPLGRSVSPSGTEAAKSNSVG